MDLQGIALIVGGGSGIGKATAALLAEEGCQKIVIADRNVESLDAVVASIKNHHPGTDVKTTFVDVKSETSVEQMVEYVVKTFGRIDYCANVAGIIRYGDTSVLSVEDFDEVQSINLRGIFLCAKAEITAMLLQKPLQNKFSSFPSRGTIVNVSSQAGLMGNGNLPSYVASKHGVVGLSKSDGMKFASQGIRVNAVCPGTIATPMLSQLPSGNIGNQREVERARDIAIGRIGTAEEIAHCIIFLLSGRSSYVTATTLAVHGGLRNT